MFFIVIDLLSTGLDCLLFHLLIHSKYPFRHQKTITYSLLFVFCIGTSILRRFSFPIAIYILLILCFSIIYALTQFSISVSNTIFWCITFIVSVFISDQIAYSVILLLGTSYLTQLETSGCIRFQGMLIYYPSLVTITAVFSKKRTSQVKFPSYMLVTSVFLVFAGGMLLYLLLSTTTSLSNSYNLNNTIYHLEIANILLLLVFALTLFQFNQTGKIYARHIELLQKQQTILAENERLKNHQDTDRLIREWKHDFNNHMEVLYMLSNKQQWSDLSNYIEEMYHKKHPSSVMLSTGNIVLDSVLSAKILTANQYNIPINWSVFLPDPIPLSPVELTAIISNLMDNAINATKIMSPEQDPYISFCIKPVDSSLFVIISNRSSGHYTFSSSGALLSDQISIEHGIGLNRVKEIVDSHGGFMQIKPEETDFTVKLLIPLIESAPN